MELVTPTGAIARRLGDKKAIEEIAKAGFDGYDYTMFGTDDEFLEALRGENALSYVKDLKKFAGETGIPCLQAHAPCPSVPKFATVERYVKMSLQAIRFASELECDTLVVHPGIPFTAEEDFERIYAPLLGDAERLGVRIAAENMYRWKDERETETVPASCGTAEDFVRHIDVGNSPYYTACLDVGHAQMQNCEGAAKMIRALGKKRLGALHVHDNDLKDDWHTFPFVGKSDWEEIVFALAEADYQGRFTFEADNFMERYPNELLPDCLTLLEKTGRYLIKKIEEKRLSVK